MLIGIGIISIFGPVLTAAYIALQQSLIATTLF